MRLPHKADMRGTRGGVSLLEITLPHRGQTGWVRKSANHVCFTSGIGRIAAFREPDRLALLSPLATPRPAQQGPCFPPDVWHAGVCGSPGICWQWWLLRGNYPPLASDTLLASKPDLGGDRDREMGLFL